MNIEMIENINVVGASLEEFSGYYVGLAKHLLLT
jgi:hypothetical protein